MPSDENKSPTRSIEYYRLWAGNGGDSGTWDTDFVEIPADTPEPQIEQAVRDAAGRIAWQEEPPVLTGVYCTNDDELCDDELSDESPDAVSHGDKEPDGEQSAGPAARIVISVYGGVVQDVFCSAAEAEVSIVDWDAECCSKMDKGYVVVLDKFEKESPAIVSSCLAEPLRAISGTPIQVALERAGVACGGVRPLAAADNCMPLAGQPPAEDDARCDCEHPGYFYSGVAGIIARIEKGRLAQGAAVERCDACERYPSDEAALEKLRELGIA